MDFFYSFSLFKYLSLLFVAFIIFVRFAFYLDCSYGHVNMITKYTNISIIIETDSFDYKTFGETWGRVLLDINFHVKSVYFYVHRYNKYSKKQGKYKESNEPTKESLLEMVRSNISYPRIVISDLPENGYLPLMISSYTDDMYPLQVICYIDARNIQNKKHMANIINGHSMTKNPLSLWIEKAYDMHLRNPSLASVFGFKTQIKINEQNLPQYYDSSQKVQNKNRIVKKTVGCDVVMVKENIVRELLYYSKVSMDSPSPFLTLSLINDLKVQNSYDNLISTQNIQNVDFFPFSKSQDLTSINKVNDEFKCPGTLNKAINDTTFSVFIPCFKRNYFKQILSIMDNQTAQPSYYVLVQNRFYRYIDVEDELSHYLVKNEKPIYKVWMVNYNSFFILPNLVTSLLNTDFVFRFDDDHIPTKNYLLSYVLRRELKENLNGDVIMGDRLSVLNIIVGDFRNKNSIRILCYGNPADYVASPYIYRPYQMKLSGRLRPLFLAGGEDAHFGLSSSILCDTVSKHLKFNYRDLSGDGFAHGKDNEIRKYIHKTVNLPGHLIHNVYAYYVKIGLKPKCWKNFTLDPKDRIDGAEYLHTSFL